MIVLRMLWAFLFPTRRERTLARTARRLHRESRGGFYVPDEPAADVVAAFERGTKHLTAPSPGGDPVMQPTPPTTQARYPWRATLRTAAAALVGLVLLFPVVADQLGITAVPAVATALAVIATVTRILAIPAVEVFLHDHASWLGWLSAAPAPKLPPPSPPVGDGALGQSGTDQ